MARSIPYVFCRYRLAVGEESLDVSGQRQLISEKQGSRLPHGRMHADRPQASALIMEPGEIDSQGNACLTWAVGIQPGVRVKTDYDSDGMSMNRTLEADTHIKFAPILALPERGLMAIQDRSSDERISARQAIGAFRSIVHGLYSGDGSFEVHHGDATDIARWLDEWDLKEYSYTVSPLNPISASDLAERRSDAMKRENVSKEIGKMQPPEGQAMHLNQGAIQEADELAAVGYGQRGFRGRTPDGHTAHVLKPRFHDDRAKNLAEQRKPQFVRVLFEPAGGDEPVSGQVAAALKRFYPS